MTEQSSCKIPHWPSLWGLAEYLIRTKTQVLSPPRVSSHSPALPEGYPGFTESVFSCTMTLTSPWCLQWQANRKRMRNEVLGLQLPWWPHLSEKNSSMAFLAWLLSSCFSRCCKHSSKMDSSRPLRIRRGIDKDRIRTYRNNFNNHNSSERPEVIYFAITIPVNFPPIESSSSSKRKKKNNWWTTLHKHQQIHQVQNKGTHDALREVPVRTLE